MRTVPEPSLRTFGQKFLLANQQRRALRPAGVAMSVSVSGLHEAAPHRSRRTAPPGPPRQTPVPDRPSRLEGSHRNTPPDRRRRWRVPALSSSAWLPGLTQSPVDRRGAHRLQSRANLRWCELKMAMPLHRLDQDRAPAAAAACRRPGPRLPRSRSAPPGRPHYIGVVQDAVRTCDRPGQRGGNASHACGCTPLSAANSVQDPSPFHTVARGVTSRQRNHQLVSWPPCVDAFCPMSVPADDDRWGTNQDEATGQHRGAFQARQCGPTIRMRKSLRGWCRREGGARPETPAPQTADVKALPGPDRHVIATGRRRGWTFSSKDPPIARPPCHRSPDEALHDVPTNRRPGDRGREGIDQSRHGLSLRTGSSTTVLYR